MTSPWTLALGSRLGDLDPALAVYFSTIPPGSVGHGTGTFDRVGTPRRWLWPVLALLGRGGIAFPVWEHDVPFQVENRPGAAAITATLRFRFRSGERVMRHEMRLGTRGLVDVLGNRGLLEADLVPEVVDGRLEVRSTALRLRLGRLRVPVPLAPRLHLVESRDGDRQRVSVTLTAPVGGRLYEYAGAFEYRIEAA